MTEVHFYHNAHDRVGTACHLVAKAFGAGRKVAVLLPDEASARALDQQLWARQPGSFLPHVSTASPLAAQTPIVLGTTPPEGGWTHGDVLINLGPTVPAHFEHFAMVVEVVGTEEQDRLPARERWRHYAAAGITPVPHNSGGSAR